MKWYKHISDSLTDPFISSLMEEFGPLGYLVFFGVLEIYAREFKIDPGWSLKISRHYLARMLNLRRSDLMVKCLRVIGGEGGSRTGFEQKLSRVLTKVEQSFDKSRTGFQQKLSNENGKWVITFSGKGDKNIEIFIPKFRELMSDATLRKLRKKRRDKFEHATEKKRLRDADADADAEEDKSVSPDGDTSPAVADDLPAAPKLGSNGKAKKGLPPCPHGAIIALYHELLPELPKVRVWSEPRRKLLRARWREDKTRQNLDWWREYFARVQASPFLMGQVKSWQADLEWLVRPSNLPRVLEGRYAGNGRSDEADPFAAARRAANDAD